MDVDAFVAVHREEWNRLGRLARRRRLSGAEVDELVTLYRRAATHLSVVRSSATADPALVSSLSTTVARARAAVAGGHEPPLREIARFATVSFPAAVYRSGRWSIGTALASIAVGVATGYWVASSPEVQAAVGSREAIRQLVEVDFERYYSESPAAAFAAQVWTNNAWVAALCFVLGITGIGVVWVLFTNAVNVGLVGGLMAEYDRLDLFFGLITPHGLLELTAVFVAAGSGLRLFAAWVDPGPLPREQAVAREGRSMVSVALGLVVVLLASGVIEAFVTPSPLPTWARIAIGAAAWAVFLGYVWVFGRRAAQAGETGDLRSEIAGDSVPVAG